MYNKLIESLFETIYVTFIVSILVLFLGIIVGVILYGLRKKELFKNENLYLVLSFIINLLRSIPFIILLIILMPFTNLIIGKITGPNAAIPALVISVFPMFARLIETTLLDLDQNLLELKQVLNLNKRQFITKILLKEARPAIISNFTTVIIATIGYGAMAGVIGAGGLGSYAYSYGFQRSNEIAIFLATILILIIVFIIDLVSKNIIKKYEYR